MLKAIYMWNTHDYLAYGLFTGYQVKGYMSCLICGPNMDTWCSSHLKKKVYQGHRRYLDKHYPYQRNCVAFNGQLEHKFASTLVFAVDFFRKTEEQEEWLSKITQAWDDKDDHVHVHGVKWKNIFFQLPYRVVCLSTTNNALVSFYSSSRFPCAHESNLIWHHHG